MWVMCQVFLQVLTLVLLIRFCWSPSLWFSAMSSADSKPALSHSRKPADDMVVAFHGSRDTLMVRNLKKTTTSNLTPGGPHGQPTRQYH